MNVKMPPQQPVVFGGLVKRVSAPGTESAKTNPVAFNTKQSPAAEVNDTHNLTLRAAEQNFASQGFPPALAKYTTQDKALMPTKPGMAQQLQNNVRTAFRTDQKEETSFSRGAEVEQEQEAA